MFNYWIQRHDYSSAEVTKVSVNETINAFLKFDWGHELKSIVNDPTQEKDCPPGIGIHNGFGKRKNAMLLHICPIDTASVFFNFHYPQKLKFLGIFNYRIESTKYVEFYSFAKVPEIIHALFNEKLDSILNL